MERSRLAPHESQWQELFDRFDESKAAEEIGNRIVRQQAAIGLASRALSIRHMPGFEDFQGALRDVRASAVAELTSTTRGNEWLRVLQGQVQAYDKILAIMEKGQSYVEALEQGLQELQDQRAAIVRHNRKTEAPE